MIPYRWYAFVPMEEIMNKRFGAIMFDLDGTLLPMDTEQFMGAYFKELGDYFAANGYTQEEIIPKVRHATRAMIFNDGKRTNEEVFWETFFGEMGEDARSKDWDFEPFYNGPFQALQALTGENKRIRETIQAARAAADHVILATNSVFPPCGIAARLAWLGLEPSDFDLVTTFDNSCFSKPNPLYFKEILEKFNVSVDHAFMVGNDAQQDALAATTAGVDTFLITDCLITRGVEWEHYRHGSYDEMLALLKSFAE